MKNRLYAIAALALVAAAAPAAAQVSLDNKVLREEVKTDANGVKTTNLVQTRNIAPGSTAVYVMTVRNGGARPASNLVISNPIPRDLVYMGPGADSAAPDVSVDGGRSFGQLASLNVRGVAGPRAAQFADVTNVRWTIAGPLARGAASSVSYRARVR